jgi:hypothetical protein
MPGLNRRRTPQDWTPTGFVDTTSSGTMVCGRSRPMASATNASTAHSYAPKQLAICPAWCVFDVEWPGRSSRTYSLSFNLLLVRAVFAVRGVPASPGAGGGVLGLCCFLWVFRARDGRVSRHGPECRGRGGCCGIAADPARCQRPGGIGLFLPGRRRSAARVWAIGLFRYMLVREAADPALTSRQRGAMVREIAAREHEDPAGQRVRLTRWTLDRWIREWRRGGFDALVPAPRQSQPRTPPEVMELAAEVRRPLRILELVLLCSLRRRRH